MAEDTGITVVVPTFNRSAHLEVLLDSLLHVQPPSCSYDIVVADNGSTDDTADVVRRVAARSPIPLRRIEETRHGAAYARNAAMRATTRPIIAFTDDDQDVAHDWLVTIERTFASNPGVQVIGGRVLPRWKGTPVALSEEMLGPASIVDRGSEPFRVSCGQWMCLPGGNMAWRREALLALDGFCGAYSRTEDRELLVRHLLAGGQALYVPQMVVYHHLDRDRITRRFARAWNRNEGRMRAGYAFEELFATDGTLRPLAANAPRILGVSRYVYREWLLVLGRYVRSTIALHRDEAFHHEVRLIALSSYIRRRIELTATPEASFVHRAGAAAVAGVMSILS